MLPTALLDKVTLKSNVVIPDVITLTRDQVLELDAAWGKQMEFCTRMLGLVLVNRNDITVNYAGYREVFTIKHAQSADVGWYLLGLPSIIQKVKNGGKTDSQIAVEEAARKIADILTREHLA